MCRIKHIAIELYLEFQVFFSDVFSSIQTFAMRKHRLCNWFEPNRVTFRCSLIRIQIIDKQVHQFISTFIPDSMQFNTLELVDTMQMDLVFHTQHVNNSMSMIMNWSIVLLS